MHDLFALLGILGMNQSPNTTNDNIRRSCRGPKSIQERNQENKRKIKRQRQRNTRKQNRT